MSANESHDAALDVLQTSFDQVLEHMGRVFAAMNTSPSVPPVAQVVKLKQAFPVANNRFNGALDQMEYKLQVSMAVMRRDLALARERSGRHQPPSQTLQQAQTNGSPAPKQESPSLAANEMEMQAPAATVIEAPIHVGEEDTVMQDSAHEPGETATVAEPNASDDIIMFEEPPTTVSADEKLAQAPAAQPKPEATENSGNDLHINTKPTPPSTEDEKAPDTANDLDSLFNDPISADNTDETTGVFPFGGQNHGDGIDFGDFGQNFDTTGALDNDNISSLLPGLEDYANNQSSVPEEVEDLDELFGLGNNESGNEPQQPQEGDASSQQQRDTTFDELLDMNFDSVAMEGDGSNPHNIDFDNIFE